MANKKILISLSLVISGLTSFATWALCPNQFGSPTQRPLEQTPLPIAAGEKSQYFLYFYGLTVGTLELKVEQNKDIPSYWVFRGSVKSSEITSSFFTIQDTLESLTEPLPYRTLRTKLEQNEKYLLGKNVNQRKVLDFRHPKCQITETIEKKAHPPEVDITNYPLEPGAMDLISAIHKLRSIPYEQVKKASLTVFSSGKNWTLKVLVEGVEDVRVAAGLFPSYKLKLETHIGSKLQQKGNLYMWIGATHPNKPMVKMVGDVKLGQLKIELNQFQSPKINDFVKDKHSG